MEQSASESSLTSSVAKFDEMLNKFGVVTVMDAYVFDNIPNLMKKVNVDIKTLKIDEIIKYFVFEEKSNNALNGYLTKLDTLKITNINIEGPDKTITGGRFNDVLVKFGKKARVEMQDALGNAKALEIFGGAVTESFTTENKGGLTTGGLNVLHLTENFASAKTIVGDSFFIDQKTGAQVPVKIVLYNVMPDSIFNLSQDSEGNATVFDMNADLGTQIITIGTSTEGQNVQSGVFYSVTSNFVKKDRPQEYIKINSKGKYVVEQTPGDPTGESQVAAAA